MDDGADRPHQRRRLHHLSAADLEAAAGAIGFGIGGASGGLLAAFQGGGGPSHGHSALQKQIDTAQKRLAVNPPDQRAPTQMIRLSLTHT